MFNDLFITLLNTLLALFNAVRESQTLQLLVGIWLLICIAWSSKRSLLFHMLNDLISKPVILDTDTNPASVPFYPRGPLERMAMAIKRLIDQPLTFLTGPLTNWLRSAYYGLVYDPQRRWKTILSVALFVAALGFIWADAIAIANTLSAAGALGGVLPDWLARFDVAIGFGSLGAIVVSVLLFLDIQSSKSKYTDFDTKGPSFRAFVQSLCIIITFIGVVVVIAFGVDRLLLLNFWQDYREPLDRFVKITWYIGVPLNTVLTTAVIAAEGLEGFVTVLLVILTVFLGLLILLNKIAQPLAVVILVLFDYTYRLLLAILNVLWYIVITPIDAVIAIVTWPFRAMRPRSP